MESKSYEVNTLQEMINCTNETNLDAFLIDLKTVIESAHNLQNLAYVIAEAEGEPKELANMTTDGFTWIDDGEHKATIQIGVKPKDI